MRNGGGDVESALVAEEIAFTAWHTLTLAPDAQMQSELLNRHYLRKHGENAYYGQKR